MQIVLNSIPIREALHFLGWRGSPLEPKLIEEIQRLSDRALETIQPKVVVKRFAMEADGTLAGCTFIPRGGDVRAMLTPCHETLLMAATLGAQSERLLLREQAQNGAQAVLLDAVLSAAIENVCDQAEHALRCDAEKEGLYLTDRFSPGYGDMPLGQSLEICEVLSASRSIGLTVSSSGILIPRKSVTAVMGISRTPVSRRPSGCEGCSMKKSCALSRMKK